MPWFRIDDSFHSHPKVITAGNAAVGLFVRMGSYSANHLTNGFISSAIASQIGTPAQVRKLLESGLIFRVDGGYQMHDYLTYNPSKDRVERDRAEAAERQQKARASQRDSQRDITPKSQRDSHDPGPARPNPSVNSWQQQQAGTDARETELPPAAAAAIGHLIEYRMVMENPRSPLRYRQALERALPHEHHQALTAHLAEHPDATAVELCEAVLGVSQFDLFRQGVLGRKGA